jgi:hypothetical protein
MHSSDEEMEFRANFSSQWTPSDDPKWDADFCKCENNSDFCEYCLSFEHEDN